MHNSSMENSSVVHRLICLWCLESSAVVLHRESRLVFCKTIIRVINILFMICELCITLVLLVCVIT
jgi:hypothetical protein